MPLPSFLKKKTDDEVAREITEKRAAEKAAASAAAADAHKKAAAAAASKVTGVVTESKVSAVIAEMKENPGEKGATFGGAADRLKVLADLCSGNDGDKCARRAAQEGGLPSVVASMKGASSLEVQLEGCRALSAIVCGEDASRALAAKAGAIQAAAAAMRAHPQDALVQQYGCRALGDICQGGEHKSLAAGAVGSVVAALKTHAEKEEAVALHGCHALSSLCGGVAPEPASEDSWEETQVHWKAVGEGGLAAVVGAMRAQAGAPLVQQHGCSALAALCAGEDADADARAEKAAEAGALEAVIAALRARAASPARQARVQEFGCLALGTLCRGETCIARKQRAIEAGAFEAAVAAMRSHTQVVGVQEEAVGALINLCNGSDEAADARRQRAGEAGAKQAINAAMRGGDAELWQQAKELADDLP